MRYMSWMILVSLAWALVSSDAWSVQEQPSTDEASRAQYRESLQLLETECMELAKQLRSQPSVQPREQQLLTELVERTFKQRQDLFRLELRENQRRFEKLGQIHEQREKSKAQIVQRRVEELLNPNIDWTKQESANLPADPIAERKSEPLPGSDRAVVRQVNEGDSTSSPIASAFPGESPSSSSSVSVADLLRISPTQMREDLIDKALKAKDLRDTVERNRLLITQVSKNAEDQEKLRMLQNALKSYETNWKIYEGQLQFAKLQYMEVVKYLEAAVIALQSQLAIAEEKLATIKRLYDTGQVTRLELMSASGRPRELQIELLRVQSLLKLYRAAGDNPELNELSRSITKLNFVVQGAGMRSLGAPKWIDGKGGATTSTMGMSIHLDLAGQNDTARMLFAKIPEHEDTPLMVKIDVANSDSKAWERVGRSWNPMIDVIISQEDVQTALTGKPLRKSYLLRPDLTVLETTSGESEDANKDALLATIELAKTSQ